MIFGIWLFLGTLVASYILNKLTAPKPQIEAARSQRYGRRSFPSASDGIPIPIAYGKVRISDLNAILIPFRDAFRVFPIRKNMKTGAFSSKGIVVGHEYGGTFVLGVCLGSQTTARQNLLKVYAGEKVIASAGGGLASNFAIDAGVRNVWGGFGEGGGVRGRCFKSLGNFTEDINTSVPWGMLSSDYGEARRPGHRGIIWLALGDATEGTANVGEPLVFGEQPELPPISVEYENLPNALGNPNVGGVLGPDANPAEVLYDVLTGTWGKLGLATSLVDTASFLSAAQALDTEVHGISLAVTQSTSAGDLVQEILRQIDGVIYEDIFTGKVKLKLIREDYVLATLPLFDQNNVLEVQEFKVNTWNETFNQVRVAYVDRDRLYQERVAIAQDQANQFFQNKVRSSDVSYPGIHSAALANDVAARELKSLSQPATRVKLRCNRDAVDLRPGDMIRWTWPDYGITDMPLRVERIDYGTLEDGAITIDALRDRFDNKRVTPFSFPVSPFSPGDNFVDPSDVDDDDAFEVPRWIAAKAAVDRGQELVQVTDNPMFAFLAASPTTRDISLAPETSADGVTFEPATSTQISFTVRAELWLPYLRAAGSDQATGQGQGHYDTATGITISAPGDLAVLADASPTDIRNDGVNLLKVDDELMAFETYRVNADGTYTLLNVWRGLADTAPRDHAVGASVWFVAVKAVDIVGSRMYAPATPSLQVRNLSFTGMRGAGTAPTRTVFAAVTAPRAQIVAPAAPLVVTPAIRVKRPVRAPTITLRQYRTQSNAASGAEYLGPTSGREHAECVVNEAFIEFSPRDKTSLVLKRGDENNDPPEAGITYRVEARLAGEAAWKDVKYFAFEPEQVDIFLGGGLKSLPGLGIGPCRLRNVPLQTTSGVTVETLFPEEHLLNLREHRQLLRQAYLSGTIDSDTWSTVSGTPSFISTGGLGETGYLGTTAAATFIARQRLNVSAMAADGRTAKLEFYAKNFASDTDDVADVILRARDGALNTLDTATVNFVPINTGWERRTLTLVVPAGTTYLDVELRGDAIVNTIPNVGFDAVDLRISGAFSSQLLPNNNFESGLTSWTTVQGSFTAFSSPNNGINPMERSGWVRANDNEVNELKQEVAITTPGDLLHLTWHQASNKGSGQAVLEVWDTGFVNKLSTITAPLRKSNSVVNPSQIRWGRRDLYLAIPVGGVNARVRLITAKGGDDTVIVGFDDVWLHRLEQPIYYPRSAEAFELLARYPAAAGPTSAWVMDQTGADPARDVVGGVDLTPDGAPTQGTFDDPQENRVLELVTGQLKRVQASSAALLDPGTGSFAFFVVARITSAAGATMQLAGKRSGASTEGWVLETTSAGALQFVVHDGAASTTVSRSNSYADGSVLGILCVVDRRKNQQRIHVWAPKHLALVGSIVDTATGTPPAGDVTNAEKFTAGPPYSSGPSALVALCAYWSGEPAESVGADWLDRLMRSMGHFGGLVNDFDDSVPPFVQAPIAPETSVAVPDAAGWYTRPIE